MNPDIAAGLAALEVFREEKLGDPYRAHKAELAEWEAARSAVAAELLGMETAEMTPLLISWAATSCSRPDLLEGRPVWKPPKRQRTKPSAPSVTPVRDGHRPDAPA